MEVKKFSWSKLLVDTLLIGGFIACHFYELENVIQFFIFLFWFSSIMCFLVAFMPDRNIREGWNKARGWQTIYSELIFSFVLAYFGYVFLACFGVISGYLIAGKLTHLGEKQGGSND